MPMSVTSDLMFRSHSCCNSKIYGKTVWRNSCQQIPEKDQSYVKVGRNNVCYIEVLKLWVRLWSIFHCNVNSEFTFDEQWMKKTSRDSTLDFFWFHSKIFFPKIWAAKLRVQLICRCGLSAGFYGNRKDKCHQWWWLHGPLGLSTDISFDLFISLSVIVCFICLNYSGLSIQNGTSDERFVFNIKSFISAIRWFFVFFWSLLKFLHHLLCVLICPMSTMD